MHRFTTKILEDDHTGDLYVILPDAIFAEADLMAGDEVEYSVDNETILLEKTNNEWLYFTRGKIVLWCC